MSLMHAVLGVLEVRPMTGYELGQFLEASARWVWSAPQSQIYPLLKQLAEDGLIVGTRSVKGTRMEVTAYSVTPRGLDELRRWLSEPLPLAPVRDTLLLQALYSDLVDVEHACRVFEAHAAELEQAIADWRAHHALLLRMDTPLMRERVHGGGETPTVRSVLIKANVFQGLVRIHEARLAWVRDTLALLRASDALLNSTFQEI